MNEAKFVPRQNLSEYGFFQGPLAALDPVPGVYAYNVNTPLFSNYAEKLRFLKLPEGTKITYRDSAVFDFPAGTVLIKNFYYPVDFRKPEKGRTIIETRLLVLDGNEWHAFPYIWNDAQTEAIYDPAGERMDVKYIDASGKKVVSPYLVPNKNQCKGCHVSATRIAPIGTSARQLSANVAGENRTQLQTWYEQGLLDALPSEPSRAVVWDDPSSGSVDKRARAYLDANCGHCHSRTGSANTSGLYLDIFEKDPAHLGVFKSPVAAGRGAGNMKFDIVPGEPDKSILVYRMRTNDPAIAMPEIGREQVHKQGLTLIEEWIRTNTFSETHDAR